MLKFRPNQKAFFVADEHNSIFGNEVIVNKIFSRHKKDRNSRGVVLCTGAVDIFLVLAVFGIRLGVGENGIGMCGNDRYFIAILSHPIGKITLSTSSR